MKKVLISLSTVILSMPRGMKKAILLGLLLSISCHVAYGTDFKIELKPNFLKYNGDYKFIMDVKGKLKDKVFELTVADGKIKDFKGAKGIKGRNISFKDNIITIKAGVAQLKVAEDLEVLPLAKDFNFGSSTMGLKKTSKEFTVDVGPGLAVRLTSAEKPKAGKSPAYKIAAGQNLPDGSYTAKLIIPVTAQKRQYNLRSRITKL